MGGSSSKSKTEEPPPPAQKPPPPQQQQAASSKPTTSGGATQTRVTQQPPAEDEDAGERSLRARSEPTPTLPSTRDGRKNRSVSITEGASTPDPKTRPPPLRNPLLGPPVTDDDAADDVRGGGGSLSNTVTSVQSASLRQRHVVTLLEEAEDAFGSPAFGATVSSPVLTAAESPRFVGRSGRRDSEFGNSATSLSHVTLSDPYSSARYQTTASATGGGAAVTSSHHSETAPPGGLARTKSLSDPYASGNKLTDAEYWQLSNQHGGASSPKAYRSTVLVSSATAGATLESDDEDDGTSCRKAVACGRGLLRTPKQLRELAAGRHRLLAAAALLVTA